MKILFVIHGLRAGGAERVLTTLANYLAIHGYNVNILLFKKENTFYELNPNINLIYIHHQLKNKSLFAKIQFLYQRIYLLQKKFKEINPNIIISFITIMNIYSIIAAFIAKKKIIVSEHTNFTRDEFKILGYIRRIVYPFANKVIVLTEYDYEKYSFLKNVQVIRNPLVLNHKFSNIIRKKIILGVGSLVDLKGFDRLIKAFAKIDNKEWQLIIVGEGDKRKELEKLIKDLKLETKVNLPGLTKNIEMYYKKASIFVLSSKIEGFPSVLCEAIGYGCASIAFDCISGPKEIIRHYENGILVEEGNIDKLSYEIQNLINNPKLRDSLCRYDKEIQHSLNIEAIGNQWIKLLKEFKT